MEGEELIRKCQKGDAKAQAIFYDRYATSLYRLCCRYVKDSFEAEDILVRGFYKVFRSIGSFRYQDVTTLSAWIRRIMVNECLMHLRQSNSLSFVHLSEEQDYTDHTSVKADGGLSAEDILALLLELPAGYRTVFNLFVIEGFTHREIAEQLQISEEVSRAQLSRAKAMLRVILTKHDMKYEI